MIRRVKQLTVVGCSLALSLSGCAFQGVNSLPLPGAVGRGPDAVTYHVQVAECRDAGVEFAGADRRRRRRQRRQDDRARLACRRARSRSSPMSSIPANVVATVGQTSLLGFDAPGAESAAR